MKFPLTNTGGAANCMHGIVQQLSKLPKLSPVSGCGTPSLSGQLSLFRGLT